MKKTASEVINDLYPVVEASPLAAAVNGSVYKGGMRPANALTEDLVIDFVSGTVSQIQDGVIQVSIFVPDLHDATGSAIFDIVRCSELEALANQWAEEMEDFDGYSFSLAQMIGTTKHEDQKQHVVNIQLKFNYTTF